MKKEKIFVEKMVELSNKQKEMLPKVVPIKDKKGKNDLPPEKDKLQP